MNVSTTTLGPPTPNPKRESAMRGGGGGGGGGEEAWRVGKGVRECGDRERLRCAVLAHIYGYLKVEGEKGGRLGVGWGWGGGGRGINIHMMTY